MGSTDVFEVEVTVEDELRYPRTDLHPAGDDCPAPVRLPGDRLHVGQPNGPPRTGRRDRGEVDPPLDREPTGSRDRGRGGSRWRGSGGPPHRFGHHRSRRRR